MARYDRRTANGDTRGAEAPTVSIDEMVERLKGRLRQHGFHIVENDQLKGVLCGVLNEDRDDQRRAATAH